MTDPPPTQQLAARLTDIEKSFGIKDSYVHVLKGSSLQAYLGEMHLIIGPSGCGKTTLLSILCGTLKPDAGEVCVFEQPLHTMKAGLITKFRAQNIGFVFQQFNLIPTLTITENVAVPLLINGWSASKAEVAARSMLEQVGLGDRARVRPGKLSGGQQQRVAIARAMVHNPRLLVCDEPTSALDKDTGLQIMELLRQITADANRAVIIVTHDPRVYKFADRISEMEDGQIIQETNDTIDIKARYLSDLH